MPACRFHSLPACCLPAWALSLFHTLNYQILWVMPASTDFCPLGGGGGGPGGTCLHLEPAMPPPLPNLPYLGGVSPFLPNATCTCQEWYLQSHACPGSCRLPAMLLGPACLQVWVPPPAMGQVPPAMVCCLLPLSAFCLPACSASGGTAMTSWALCTAWVLGIWNFSFSTLPHHFLCISGMPACHFSSPACHLLALSWVTCTICSTCLSGLYWVLVPASSCHTIKCLGMHHRFLGFCLFHICCYSLCCRLPAHRSPLPLGARFLPLGFTANIDLCTI